MKFFYAILMVIAIATSAMGASISPPIPTDGNGNIAPVIWDATNSVWLKDSGVYNVTATIGAVSVNAPTYITNGVGTDTVTVTNSRLNTNVRTTPGDSVYIAIAPLARMTLASCTFSGTSYTLDLGDTYSEVRVFADTIAVISFNGEAAPTSVLGDIIVDEWIPYVNVAIRYINIISYDGASSGAKRFRVRAMK